MTFIEAIREVLNGNVVKSCNGSIYNKSKLKPKRLSDSAYVVNSVTTEKERKGEWIIIK